MAKESAPNKNMPVLLTPAEVRALPEDVEMHGDFYVEPIDKVLEAKRATGQNAVRSAVAALLTESAVAIMHVNTDEQRQSYLMDDSRMLYDAENDFPIGFNDHFGGSESYFKILLNGSPSDADNGYVLYSPPDSEGRPTNLDFHRAHFTFITEEPDGLYPAMYGTPNPLKTNGVRQYRTGEPRYQHYLFGGPEVPGQVYAEFARAGFGFVKHPYSSDFRAEPGVMTNYSLRAHESAAHDALGYKGNHFWPGDQFAANLELLGIPAPKLSPKDYPLVRPENSL